MRVSPPELAAVLFDMDGTIVDTEPYWIEAEYALVTAHGGTWNDDHAHALVGNALLASAEYIRQHGGVDLPPEQIVELLLADVVRRADQQMPWRPGARELVAELAAQSIPCGLVTMSYQILSDAVVADLLPLTFAAVVTGDQVTDGKPHPEAYLTAAGLLDVDPSCCVAIEDSPTGIASAEAAGCVVLAVPHRVPIEPGPRRVLVDSLADVDVAMLQHLVRDR